MAHGNLLFQSFVYLLAAVIAVPIARRLGLGAVLGYLIAGMLIGPSMLGLAGDSEDVIHFAEFGVVMMLFLIGLELRPAMLWRLRGPILGMGGTQVICVTAAVMCIAGALGIDLRTSLALGLILAMSSTAIVLQSLAERNLLKLTAGQACFSVLLFQDIAVIPILAILPLLGRGGAGAASHGPLAALPGWLSFLATLGAVASLVIVGRFLLRHVFRYVAASRLGEVFTELTLLLVIGTTLLMQMVGLSAALGAFLAGVVLSENEYRHQLEADLEPFKGILLGLFFITVGAGIDFAYVARHPLLIAGLVAGLILLKCGAHLALARLFRMNWGQSLTFALALAQGGEFCFVLIQYSTEASVFGPGIAKPLVAAVALSMALTPLLFLLNDRWIQPMFLRQKSLQEREPDDIPEEDNPVILVGFGRFGHVVGRLLRANGFGCTVLDSDADQVDTLGKFGMKSFYGDASRLDLLRAAGAQRAKLFILTIKDTEKSLAIIRTVQREFPHLHILARAHSRDHAYELINAGVKHVYHDTLGSSLDLGVTALRELGMRGHQAVRAARILKSHDYANIHEMAAVADDEQAYISMARKHLARLNEVLQDDRMQLPRSKDEGWEIGEEKRTE